MVLRCFLRLYGNSQGDHGQQAETQGRDGRLVIHPGYSHRQSQYLLDTLVRTSSPYQSSPTMSTAREYTATNTPRPGTPTTSQPSRLADSPVESVRPARRLQAAPHTPPRRSANQPLPRAL